MNPVELNAWMAHQPPALAATLLAIAGACADVGEAAALGPLVDLHGEAESRNRRGALHKKLDLHADDLLAAALNACPHVAGWASAAHNRSWVSDWHGERGEYLVVFDPLDGSANIETNLSVGSIFSVWGHPFLGTPPGAAGFMQPGRRQVAAGYVIYGPATVLVLSCGSGVAMFTLDRRDGRWRLTRDRVEIPAGTTEFAINASNQRFWEKPVQRYVAECLAGEEGPRGRNFTMRWVASLVAEAHRILTCGGVFLYPRDNRKPYKPGSVSLLHEAAPIAFLIEQAGGNASTGTQELLDIAPDSLHQLVPVIFGAADEVKRVVGYHADPSENVNWQLFKTRSLFVQPSA